MPFQTIVFDTPRPTNNGNVVPRFSTVVTNDRVPKRRLPDRELARRVENALEALEDTPCTFWACDGPNKPRHMVTCTRCWAVRDLRLVLRHLKR